MPWENKSDKCSGDMIGTMGALWNPVRPAQFILGSDGNCAVCNKIEGDRPLGHQEALLFGEFAEAG